MSKNGQRKLSHVGPDGRPSMVDVSMKETVFRRAEASGFISLSPEAVRLVAENKVRKGNVLLTGEVAGIMAAKNTSGVIPLCHPLMLSKVDVHLELLDNGVRSRASVSCSGQTGVEMEALHAVAVSLLTVYDMCKAVDKSMEIRDIRLDSKIKDAPGKGEIK